MFTRISLNKSNISRGLKQFVGTSLEVERRLTARVSREVARAKSAAILELENHPVTAEIDSGPRAVNISGTLGGYGNLFSFIGFRFGSKPTKALKKLVRESLDFRYTSNRRGRWYFHILGPSQQEIAAATPMDWEAGNSWALQIERVGGISGLSNYLFTRWDKGRSHYGVQLPYENMDGMQTQRTPYITEILHNFRDRIGKRV